MRKYSIISSEEFRANPQVLQTSKKLLIIRSTRQRVTPPRLHKVIKILRQRRIEEHHLARRRMHEPQSLGVQRLPWTQLETVAHKLAVAAEVGALENLIATIHIVVERMCPMCFICTLIWCVRPVSKLHSTSDT